MFFRRKTKILRLERKKKMMLTLLAAVIVFMLNIMQ